MTRGATPRWTAVLPAPVRVALVVLTIGIAVTASGSAARGEDAGEAVRLLERANALIRAGRAVDAEPLLRRAIAIREQLLANHPDLAGLLETLASVLETREPPPFSEVEQLRVRAHQLRVDHGGRDRVEVARNLEQLGRLYRRWDRATDAERVLKVAAVIRMTVQGQEHPDLADTLRELLAAQVALGHPKDVEDTAWMALGVVAKNSGLEDPRVPGLLEALADATEAQGKHEETEKALRRLLTLVTRRAGPDSVELVPALERLSGFYLRRERAVEAEPVLRRRIELGTRAGRSDADAHADLVALADVYRQLKRYDDAAAIYARLVASLEGRVPPDERLPRVLLACGMLEIERGRAVEAEARLRRALGLWGPGATSAEAGRAMLYLGAVIGPRQPGEAVDLLQRSLSLLGRSLPSDHFELSLARRLLAMGLAILGRYAEAETILRREIAVLEQRPSPDERTLATSLIDLGLLYLNALGRVTEAVALLERAENVLEKPRRMSVLLHGRALPPDPALDSVREGLAHAYARQGKLDAAERAYRQVVSTREARDGRGAFSLAPPLLALGVVHLARGSLDEAEGSLLRARALLDKELGPASFMSAIVTTKLAQVEVARGQLGRAEQLLRDALMPLEQHLGPKHRVVGLVLQQLAEVLARQANLAPARRLLDRARHIALGHDDALAVLLDDAAQLGLGRQASGGLQLHLQVLAAIAREPQLDPDGAAPAAEAFVVAEQARAGAVQRALAKAAVRMAARDPATRDLAERLQNDQVRSQELWRRLSRAGDWSGADLAAVGRSTRQLTEDIGTAADQLLARFPRYWELLDREPAGIATVQRLLGPEEALLSVFTLSDRLLAWLVRPGRPPAYLDVPVARADLARLVAALRASLDQSANPDLAAVRLQPFDVVKAHALYRLLIAPFRAQLVGARHLIVVPDALLLPLPLGALLTDAGGDDFQLLTRAAERGQPVSEPELRAYARLPWLAAELAISVLPSATSLLWLRTSLRAAVDRLEPLIGFGDPRFAADRAERRDGDPATDPVAAMSRLPATRDELVNLARVLGADAGRALFLDARATETAVRELNRDGRLGRARVLAFATHGLLAGEFGLSQPALALTRPAQRTPGDDGFLTLDEVLDLRLPGTEWVVLSACNTAAADGSGEALSGLARAFLFAGARALLVSAWSVEDRATQRLMSEVFRRYASATTAPKAEMLRQGMLALLAQAQGPTAYLGHPFAWAPFSLVGDGGPAAIKVP